MKQNKKYDCFVIMPIGNPETEFLWKDVYLPLLEGLNFEPKRAKENDDGHEMSGQIRNFIGTSSLLIADLTLARPNCYYEVGLAMGQSRESNLILCCREGENIHFDISTYYVIRWSKNKLKDFKRELAEKIKYRMSGLEPIPVKENEIDTVSIRNSMEQIKRQLDNIYQSIKPTAPIEETTKISDFYQESLRELTKWKRKN